MSRRNRRAHRAVVPPGNVLGIHHQRSWPRYAGARILVCLPTSDLALEIIAGPAESDHPCPVIDVVEPGKDPMMSSKVRYFRPGQLGNAGSQNNLPRVAITKNGVRSLRPRNSRSAGKARLCASAVITRYSRLLHSPTAKHALRFLAQTYLFIETQAEGRMDCPPSGVRRKVPPLPPAYAAKVIVQPFIERPSPAVRLAHHRRKVSIEVLDDLVVSFDPPCAPR